MNQREQREEEYRKYINEHIENVKAIWKNYCKHNTSDPIVWNDYDYFCIDYLIKNHDKSKFTPDEFCGYRQKFYPTEDDYSVEERFNQSWNHHQKHNPHHWEYWVEIPTLEANPMVFFFIIEMLCDWSAMSLKFNDLPSDFYVKNKEKMILNEKTQEHIEYYLPFFDECVKRVRIERLGVSNND